MIKNGISKECLSCKKSFYVKRCMAKRKKFCSKDCYSESMRGNPNASETKFKKGQTSWNRGTKGVMKPNSTSFKKGENHIFFKGKIKHQGYILLYTPDHPFSNNRNYVKRSRLVMEKYLGRYLTRKEVVHHRDNVRNNDRITNLMYFASESDHQSFHEQTKRDKK